MKIGNIELTGKIIQGPMAGISNEAFRLVSKQHGAALVCTEMVSIEGLIHDNQKTYQMVKVDPNEHPVSLQIFGNNVASFVKAVKLIEQHSDCDIIDLNLGCPAPKIALKSQSGSQLLNNPQLVYEIVRAVVRNTSKPVTAKIRLGWDEDHINVLEIAQLIEAAGASAITIHARTRSDFYSGHADWNQIKLVKQILKIPVIGNGDVVDPESARQMLEITGCDAVMISRAAQGNPWIFEQCNHYLKSQQYLPPIIYSEWKAVLLTHLDYLIALKTEAIAVREFRKHFAWYLDRWEKTNVLKSLKNAVNYIENRQDVLNLLEKYEKEK